jgi:hypothetical protein
MLTDWAACLWWYFGTGIYQMEELSVIFILWASLNCTTFHELSLTVIHIQDFMWSNMVIKGMTKVIRYNFTRNTISYAPEVLSMKQIIPCFSCETSVFRPNLSSFSLEWLSPAVTFSNVFSTKGSLGTATFSTHSTSSSLSSPLPWKM